MDVKDHLAYVFVHQLFMRKDIQDEYTETRAEFGPLSVYITFSKPMKDFMQGGEIGDVVFEMAPLRIIQPRHTEILQEISRLTKAECYVLVQDNPINGGYKFNFIFSWKDLYSPRLQRLTRACVFTFKLKITALKQREKRTCFLCGGHFEKTLLHCKDCHLVYYCDRDCQRIDWNFYHRQNCSLMKKLYDKTFE